MPAAALAGAVAPCARAVGRTLAGSAIPAAAAAGNRRSFAADAFRPPEIRGLGAPLPVGGPPRLRLRGLPFHATADDVRRFFRGFQLAPTSPRGADVELLRGHAGRPTGQGFAYFEDPVEAMRAADALHERPFRVDGTRVYRVDVLEDFKGRAIVKEEDREEGKLRTSSGRE
ncbi:unnamed protein product [Prorocentrum cordatum]|uniref:RRM domain-containing protein n=1 Tax=Prorocentrum cordatum TaxID=2364126 RepID=A0ABN9U1G9_9DINO|nr:unnamed protein product [Polarella glacialis]